jgi:hypothetical protein
MEGPARVKLGDEFRMGMKAGMKYSMISKVVEYEDGRRIAWQTTPPGRFAKLGGGRIWRYELEPVEGGTRVRESWDVTQERGPMKGLIAKAGDRTKKGMAQTLERIEQVVTA